MMIGISNLTFLTHPLPPLAYAQACAQRGVVRISKMAA